jgi:hypothetical protein
MDAMTEPDPNCSADKPPASLRAGQLRIPQFGILHLLIWTTVTAILLKILMTLTAKYLHDLPTAQLRISQAIQIVHVIVIASVLVATGVLLRHRCYAMPKRLQPGHWLVLLAFLDFIGEVIAPLLLLLLFTISGTGRGTSVIVSASTAAVSTLVAAVHVWAFLQLRDARWWKTLIGAKTLGPLTTAALSAVSLVTVLLPIWSPSLSLGMWVLYCPSIWSIVVFVILIIAAAHDLLRRTPRDWVHWLGVAALAENCALGVISLIYYVFFIQLGR